MATILEKANEILAEKENKIIPNNLKAGVSFFNINGTLEELVGEEIEIAPTTDAQIITPSNGFNGITKIDVSGVTAAIDSNIVAENIKAGVTILGVEGNCTSGIPAPVYISENIDVTAIKLNTEITLSKPYSELASEFEASVGGGFNTSNRWINWRNEKSNMFCSTNIQESSMYVSIVPRVNNEYAGMLDFHYTSTDGQHYTLDMGEFQMYYDMWVSTGLVGNYCDINLATNVIKFKEPQLLGIVGPNEDNNVTVDVPWTEDFAKPFTISEYVDIVTI